VIRPELSAVAPDYHGAIDFAELALWGIDPNEVIDFSVNSNPFGPADSVRRVLAAAPLERYPDKACLALRAALSEGLELPMDQIVVGNGTAELLWLVAFAVVQAGERVLIIGPTFGEYARNARLMGAEVSLWQACPENDFAVQTDEIESMIAAERPIIVHLCNPNNPTGQVVAVETIGHWARHWPGTLFVIDEAYLSFVPEMVSAVTLGLDNVLVLRSMTKDYALAGLRLGYAVGERSLIAGLGRVQIPWSVNEPAQAAGLAALEAQAEYEEMWRRLRSEAAVFRQGLADLGYRPHPSATHYFLMDVGDGTSWRERLLRQGMLVRLCESYGLPAFVRIGTQTGEENARLLAALKNMPDFRSGHEG
jgi:histidinol-phosphate aminotransferase